MDDSFDLARFVIAQDPVIDRVTAELRAGAKRSHWMWFVFPQIAGLGSSPTAIRYALRSLAEARAYAVHATLGPRLRTCTTLVLAHADMAATRIFGTPDDLKFRSCMTLFAHAAPEEAIFREALGAFFGGHEDGETIRRLG